MAEKTLIYMLTYHSQDPESQEFMPSGVIVNEAGTDRFDTIIDDLATAEVVEHYTRLIQQGALAVHTEDDKLRAMVSLRDNLTERDYSRFDTKTRFGNLYQVWGEPIETAQRLYEKHVEGAIPHPQDNI